MWYTCEWTGLRYSNQAEGWRLLLHTLYHRVLKKSSAAHLAWFFAFAKSSPAKSSTSAQKPTALQQSTYTKPVIPSVSLRSAMFFPADGQFFCFDIPPHLHWVRWWCARCLRDWVHRCPSGGASARLWRATAAPPVPSSPAAQSPLAEGREGERRNPKH